MENTTNQTPDANQQQTPQPTPQPVPQPQPVPNAGQVHNAQPQTGLHVIPKSIASMILGISSIAGAFMWGIPGLVCAILALSFHGKGKTAYNQNPGMYRQGSLGFLKTGKVTGTIGLILSIVMIIVFAFAVYYIIEENSYDYYDYEYDYYDYNY